MEQNQYNVRVLETESIPEKLNISLVGLDMTLAIGIMTAELMNKTKRAMFYGKPLEKEELLQVLGDMVAASAALHELVNIDGFQDDEIANEVYGEQARKNIPHGKIENVNIRLLHGAIGEMSETGEKLEALANQLSGEQLDIINYAEELGDSAWYNAIQVAELVVLGAVEGKTITDDSIRAMNIAKLEKRNKGRSFNAEATLNRDTAAERAVLEAGEVQ